VLVFAFDSKLSSHARHWFCMLAICLTSCLAPGCELLYVWSLAASTLADLLCMVFDNFTVSHAKSFAGPLLPVYSVTLRVLTATSCVTQSQSVTVSTCMSELTVLQVQKCVICFVVTWVL